MSNGIPRWIFNNIKLNLTIQSFLAICFLFIIPVSYMAHAQEKKPSTVQIGVGGFLDEDGDGFNDLLPDSDGDGVPDALDPDSKGQHADSVLLRQHMYGQCDSTNGMQRMMGNDFMGMMGMHGEPGQYGPGDSTGHDGMCPGDSMGWHHHGGMGGGGMGGGKIDPGMKGKEIGGKTGNLIQSNSANQTNNKISHDANKTAPADLNKNIEKHEGRKGK